MRQPIDEDEDGYVHVRGDEALVPVVRPSPHKAVAAADANDDIQIEIEPRKLSRTKSANSPSNHSPYSKAPNTSSRVVAAAILLPIALAVLFSSVGIGT
jgi:hypothetical protein